MFSNIEGSILFPSVIVQHLQNLVSDHQAILFLLNGIVKSGRAVFLLSLKLVRVVLTL